MNPWLFVFLVSVIISIFLIDCHDMSVNVWAGFISTFYVLGTNFIAYSEKLWKFSRVGEGLPGIIIFSDNINIFLLGTVFIMGILFVQFLPQNLFLQLVHASIWLILFRLLFKIAEQNGMATFTNWKAIMVSNVIPINMIGLAWIKTNFLKG